MGSDTALNKIREQDRRGPVRRPCGGAALLQRLHGVVFSGIRIAAAGQPHEFLKMHLMAVAIAGVGGDADIVSAAADERSLKGMRSIACATDCAAMSAPAQEPTAAEAHSVAAFG